MSTPTPKPDEPLARAIFTQAVAAAIAARAFPIDYEGLGAEAFKASLAYAKAKKDAIPPFNPGGLL